MSIPTSELEKEVLNALFRQEKPIIFSVNGGLIKLGYTHHKTSHMNREEHADALINGLRFRGNGTKQDWAGTNMWERVLDYAKKPPLNDKRLNAIWEQVKKEKKWVEGVAPAPAEPAPPPAPAEPAPPQPAPAPKPAQGGKRDVIVDTLRRRVEELKLRIDQLEKRNRELLTELQAEKKKWTKHLEDMERLEGLDDDTADILERRLAFCELKPVRVLKDYAPQDGPLIFEDRDTPELKHSFREPYFVIDFQHHRLLFVNGRIYEKDNPLRIGTATLEKTGDNTYELSKIDFKKYMGFKSRDDLDREEKYRRLWYPTDEEKEEDKIMAIERARKDARFKIEGDTLFWNGQEYKYDAVSNKVMDTEDDEVLGRVEEDELGPKVVFDGSSDEESEESEGSETSDDDDSDSDESVDIPAGTEDVVIEGVRCMITPLIPKEEKGHPWADSGYDYMLLTEEADYLGVFNNTARDISGEVDFEDMDDFVWVDEKARVMFLELMRDNMEDSGRGAYVMTAERRIPKGILKKEVQDQQIGGMTKGHFHKEVPVILHGGELVIPKKHVAEVMKQSSLAKEISKIPPTWTKIKKIIK